jgi:hypothetical protein
MNRNLLALALAPFLLLFGCDDLGSCKDMYKGRQPVLTPQGRVMYVGQAILISSCSTGCHASDATGKLRLGAPKGLDFDILPLDGTGTPDERAKLLSGLRRRQRKVFDERYNIWSQIEKGFMPPSGVGEGFKKNIPGTAISFDTTGACKRGEKFEAFSTAQTRAALRSWLACGAPIVELSAKTVPAPMAGTVGDQYPACAGAIDNSPTIENVFSTIFNVSCVNSCHQPGGAFPGFDLSTVDKAYTTLLGADGKGAPQSCAGNPVPYVTPGDSGKSYVYAKVAGDTAKFPICGSPMPIGPALSEDQLALLKNWIDMGAKGPGQGGGAGDGDMSGADAGM